MLAYLDNSATTRPFDEVTAKIAQINAELYGNPSSLHSMGLAAICSFGPAAICCANCAVSNSLTAFDCSYFRRESTPSKIASAFTV